MAIDIREKEGAYNIGHIVRVYVLWQKQLGETEIILFPKQKEWLDQDDPAGTKVKDIKVTTKEKGAK